jgi:3-phenylpropionate/trans-cinnamate dioxygenase ferredoxin subunit
MADLFRRALPADQLPAGKTAAVTLEDADILLCRDGEAVFALSNRCTHQDSPLEGGRIRRGAIICPLHGSPFALASGKCLSQQGYAPLRTFPARIEDGWIEVELT